MFIVIRYTLLLFLMLFVLYHSGRILSKNGYNITILPIIGIVTFSLNEGLRFGRGIDYNLYAKVYENLNGDEGNEFEYLFVFIGKYLISFGASWQYYVLLMSFCLIISGYFLIKPFSEVAKYALPLFAIFTITAENIMRWYFGLSFIWIGLSLLLNSTKKRRLLYYVCFSIIGVSLHSGLFVVPFVYYVFSFIKKPILSPILVVFLFFTIAFTFSSEMMLNFSSLLNSVNFSERFEHYQENQEFWLTGGAAGSNDIMPPYYVVFLYIVEIFYSYKMLEKIKNRRVVFAYNLFCIGFILSPIAIKIEILGRCNLIFLISQSILLAYILNDFFSQKTILYNKLIYILVCLVFLNYVRVFVCSPFCVDAQRYLYVWDSGGKKVLPLTVWIEE